MCPSLIYDELQLKEQNINMVLSKICAVKGVWRGYVSITYYWGG